MSTLASRQVEKLKRVDYDALFNIIKGELENQITQVRQRREKYSDLDDSVLISTFKSSSASDQILCAQVLKSRNYSFGTDGNWKQKN